MNLWQPVMKHKKYNELIKLFLYDELTAEEQKDLKEHLIVCTDCEAELQSQKSFMEILSDKKFNEPSPSLLNDARLQLSRSIKNEAAKENFPGFISRIVSEIFLSRKLILLGGGVTFAAGLLLGFMLFNSSLLPEDVNQVEFTQASLFESNIKINNIRIVDQNLERGEIEFVFEAVKPIRLKGRVDDPEIQNILLYSILNEENPGVRLNSVNLLSNKPEKEIDNEVKEALIIAAMHDENPGVRREALQLLNKQKYDPEIKIALLHILKNDSNSALRIEAINGLKKAQEEGYKFDENAVTILKEKMNEDENNYIRLHARKVLLEN
jgi:hypothetical protein